jgi:Flp pilus assembly pilin Flp
MLNTIRQFVKEEEGLAAAEYAILLTLIAVALIVSVTAFRDGIVRAFQGATAVLPAATT